MREPRYLTRPEALKILGIADRTFNKYIQRGFVHGQRSNFDRRRMLYRLDDIEALRDMQPRTQSEIESKEDMTGKKTLADYISTGRKRFGWNRAELQRQLADRGISLHLTTMRRFENGEQEPKVRQLATISELYGHTLKEVLELLEEPSADWWETPNDFVPQVLIRHGRRYVLEDGDVDA